MKLQKRRKKGVRWYRQELDDLAGIAYDALAPKTTRAKQEASLLAIAVRATEAAIGREAYLER